jgi:vacuolar-type H+-ATPase subunit I/STV1
MGIVDVSDHTQLLEALKKYKDREQKINQVVIVRKELKEKQVSVKETEKKLADVVHAAADANPAIRDVINQPTLTQGSTQKRNNPSKRQREMIKKRRASEAAASASQCQPNAESSAPAHKRQRSN